MSLISFEQFKWLDVEEGDESSAVDYLENEGLSDACELLQGMSKERPFIDSTGDAIVVSLQFPNWSFFSYKIRLSPASLRIVITKNVVVTVHPTDFPPLNRAKVALEQGRIRTSISSAQFVGEVLLRVVQSRFDLVDELVRMAKKLELRVFDKKDKGYLIEDLMNLKMVISDFRCIAPPQQEVVKNIVTEIRRKNWEDKGLLDDLTRRIQHIIALLDGLKDRAEIITEANEAFLNHSLNSTLRILTIFSVIMIPPGLVAGVFGMNSKVPWQEHSFGFLIMTGILGAITLTGVLYFLIRRYV